MSVSGNAAFADLHAKVLQKPKNQNIKKQCTIAWLGNSLGLPNNFEVVFHRQGGLLPPQPRQAVDVEHQKTLFST